MENKIKVGDKVKVSKDAPRMYVPYWDNEKFCAALIVKEVNDGNASVLFEGENPYKTVQRIIPTKYLIKVDAEANPNPRYKIGVEVCISNSALSKVYTIIQKAFIHDSGWIYELNTHEWYIESALEPYTEPTEQTEAEKKPNVGSIKIPVEVDLTDSYWDAYAADLAKEVVLKVVNKYEDPKKAAEYAVSVAKAVVEGLKKK